MMRESASGGWPTGWPRARAMRLIWSIGRTSGRGSAGDLPPGFFPVRAVMSSRALIFASKSAFSCASRSAAAAGLGPRASICSLAWRLAAWPEKCRASCGGSKECCFARPYPGVLAFDPGVLLAFFLRPNLRVLERQSGCGVPSMQRQEPSRVRLGRLPYVALQDLTQYCLSSFALSLSKGEWASTSSARTANRTASRLDANVFQRFIGLAQLKHAI